MDAHIIRVIIDWVHEEFAVPNSLEIDKLQRDTALKPDPGSLELAAKLFL